MACMVLESALAVVGVSDFREGETKRHTPLWCCQQLESSDKILAQLFESLDTYFAQCLSVAMLDPAWAGNFGRSSDRIDLLAPRTVAICVDV